MHLKLLASRSAVRQLERPLVETVHTPRRVRLPNMADSVTQLQDQINTLCQLMFNYAGTLQRDAKAVRHARNSRSFSILLLSAVDV